MDVIQGEYKFDFKTGKPVSEVGQKQYLDPEIANEGTKVLLSDGQEVSWNPPAAKPVIPDWSENKSIKHYFHRVGYQPFPAWFYGPNGEERIFLNREEAAQEGIIFRKASFEEKGMFGRDYVWDKAAGCHWSPIPYPGTKRFDPNNVGAGKNYIARPPDPKIAENELLARLIPLVAASVTTALKGSGEAQAPPQVDPKLWERFMAFVAFEKTQEALEPANEQPDEEPAADPQDDERSEWIAKAKEAGIKIDGRWKLDKLRKNVMKELEKRVLEAERNAEAVSAD